MEASVQKNGETGVKNAVKEPVLEHKIDVKEPVLEHKIDVKEPVLEHKIGVKEVKEPVPEHKNGDTNNHNDDDVSDGGAKGNVTVEPPSKTKDDCGDGGAFGSAGVNGKPLGSHLARMPVPRDSPRYSNSHPRRGLCVIFNHRYFDPHTQMNERNGTDKDRDQAKLLFLNLGFEVKVYDNFTAKEITDIVEDLSLSTDHSDCDMFAMVFMSHGEKEVLWGRDASFKVNFLFDQFQADQCKSLAGKPKIFFIQACRGDMLDSGVTLVRTQPSDETDSGGYMSYKIPTTADFLICWSTVPGHYSWRNTTNGSWFIQSLVKVLSTEASTDDLVSLITSVNRHMVFNFESNCPSQHHMHGKKQVSSVVSTLLRKIYLTPKY